MNIISYEKKFIVSFMIKRKIVEIDEQKCDGCGLCIPNCAEGALKIIDGKARLVSDVYCDGLGECLGHCPQDAISIIERDALTFDEKAVSEYLKEHELQINHEATTTSNTQDKKESNLYNWPVQLNLVPIIAPFWENADLILIADCAAVAQPELHSKLILGKSVIIGCPKFDNFQHYVDKLTKILKQNNVHSLTVAVMEVPCCNGLKAIAKQALEASGKMIPTQNLVITVKGKITRLS